MFSPNFCSKRVRTNAQDMFYVLLLSLLFLLLVVVVVVVLLSWLLFYFSCVDLVNRKHVHLVRTNILVSRTLYLTWKPRHVPTR